MVIREVRPGDEFALIELIKELASFEKEPDAVINTAEALAVDLFEKQYCEGLVVEYHNQLIAYAIFYTSYSTWNGPCLYLEDLYVQNDYRGKGIGKLIFTRLVDIAKERKVHRMDWQILKWNKEAILFYEREGASMDADWLNGRLFFH